MNQEDLKEDKKLKFVTVMLNFNCQLKESFNEGLLANVLALREPSSQH